MPYSGSQGWNKWLKGGTIRKAVADVEEPTIDLEKENRLEVPLKKGGIGTIYSTHFDEDDGVSRVVPTIVDGEEVDEEEAKKISWTTGRHLGRYSSSVMAKQAAEEMHLDEERRVNELREAREKAKAKASAKRRK